MAVRQEGLWFSRSRSFSTDRYNSQMKDTENSILTFVSKGHVRVFHVINLADNKKPYIGLKGTSKLKLLLKL